MAVRTESSRTVREWSRFDKLHFSALRAVARLEGFDEPTEQEFDRVSAQGIPLRAGMLEIEKTRPKRDRASSHATARRRSNVVRRAIPRNMLLRYLQHVAVVALRSLM